MANVSSKVQQFSKKKIKQLQNAQLEKSANAISKFECLGPSYIRALGTKIFQFKNKLKRTLNDPYTLKLFKIGYKFKNWPKKLLTYSSVSYLPKYTFTFKIYIKIKFETFQKAHISRDSTKKFKKI